MRGQTVAVTGAGSGIGLEAAIALASDGCPVVLGDRDRARLADAQRRVESVASGLPVAAIQVDVADAAQVHAFVSQAIAQNGRLGVLVTCAGIYEGCEFSEITPAAWDDVVDVNLRGTALCASAAARHMRDAGGGSIVMTSSISSVISEPGSGAYSASKAAINSLARTMAVDLSRYGITTNAVAPGWVRTAMTEGDLASLSDGAFNHVNAVRRAADPQEVAEVIRWLALDAPRFLTGSTLFVDGGQTAFAPTPS